MRSGRRARLVPIARAAAALVFAALVVLVGVLWWQSLRPGAYAVTDHGAHTHSGAGTSVTAYAPDPARAADVHVELTARQQRVRIGDGAPFSGYTLNGSTPGPTIRAALGDLVEVLLRNEDVGDGVTLHWHGVDVPAAMDGVAGVTQDAVPPGGTFVYRFVVKQTGTFWYHSHQISHEQVLGGLFGALVLEPAASDRIHDAVALVHTYPDGIRSLNGQGAELSEPAHAGERVLVRIVNTENTPISVWSAEPFLILAVDGTDLNGPTPVRDERVLLTAGGRLDVEVTVPDSGGVRIQLPGASVLLGGDTAPATQPAKEVDLLHYGEPAALPFDPEHPDRSYRYEIGRMPGFIDGRPGIWWSVNGRIGDDIPMFMVSEGDVVRMTISNVSGEVHPMHLHGHHMVVLSRNGEKATGSPWWVDSLNVAHGDSYEVAFLADNPGIWMDHCHNLPHAADGLIAHVGYEGVSTPFELGHDTGNEPE